MNIQWFKNKIEPTLSEFEIKYKYFEEGDFGSLNQVEFNSLTKGGEVDFWSSGVLAIHLVDYVEGVELMNEFLESKQTKEKENALRRLQNLLKK
ncbi:MAG: hypothetical protein R3E32_22180 [Chitinophagales bacterium]